MRAPCKKCGASSWFITETGAQDVVRCAACDAYAYNAPRVETGKAVRSVSTTHAAIKPKQRARVIERDCGHCVACGATDDLHVGHVVSVRDGHDVNMTDDEINSDENLVALCAACNLGWGQRSMRVNLYVAILIRRWRVVP
jgi:5-methylcytosine-specific restriction endonuclease McrA